MLLALFIACAQSGPAEVDASAVRVGEESLEQVLQRIQAPPDAGDAPPEEAQAQAQLRSLDERISRLELAIVDLQNHGTMPADAVGFDPRATTMAAIKVQDALVELHTRLAELEHQLDRDAMGQPGSALYEVGKEERGNTGGQGGPGAQGGGPGKAGKGGKAPGSQGGAQQQGGQGGAQQQGGQGGAQQQGGRVP